MSAYREFINAGHTDIEWGLYAAQFNLEFQARSRQSLIDRFNLGIEVNGIDLACILQNVPQNILRVLQDNDTVVTNKSLQARGVKRNEAYKILQYLNEQVK